MTSPLNSNVLLEVGLAAGQAARATEQRKHEENDAKCKELGWVCVPMVVVAYCAWGTEAMESFSLLASHLATSSNRAKAEVLAALYGRLNLNLVRTNATVILSRCFVPVYNIYNLHHKYSINYMGRVQQNHPSGYFFKFSNCFIFCELQRVSIKWSSRILNWTIHHKFIRN